MLRRVGYSMFQWGYATCWPINSLRRSLSSHTWTVGGVLLCRAPPLLFFVQISFLSIHCVIPFNRNWYGSTVWNLLRLRSGSVALTSIFMLQWYLFDPMEYIQGIMHTIVHKAHIYVCLRSSELINFTQCFFLANAFLHVKATVVLLSPWIE